MSRLARSTTATATTPGSRPGQKTITLRAGCVNPIRLRGYYQRIAADTGEVLATIGSPETRDGILFVACKDRRASCCLTCSRLYEKDAYQLIAAGLHGGKTVPPSVGAHPVVMLTLTAPSFGVVHGNRDRGQPCKCGGRHDIDDPAIGVPLNPARYRYADQVIWNHYAPQLWKRTTQAIRRGLAHELGVPRSKLSQVAYLRFAKVAEFQRRGVVHYHAIIRLDGPQGVDDPPPPQCTTNLLERVAKAAAHYAAVPLPETLRDLAPQAAPSVRWGTQRKIAALERETRTKAAGYIAKYATKATEATTGGTLITPIRSPGELDHLPLKDHARALISASWYLGEHARIEGLKRWAHQFGYGGHTLTKSRQYSTTFAALHAARVEWCRTASGEGRVIMRAQLSYAGRGKVRRES